MFGIIGFIAFIVGLKLWTDGNRAAAISLAVAVLLFGLLVYEPGPENLREIDWGRP